jgi:hypothetical protein
MTQAPSDRMCLSSGLGIEVGVVDLHEILAAMPQQLIL